MSDDEWSTVRTNYRSMSLSMRCCSSPAIPKLSSLGTRFFAHKSSGACQTADESPEHLRAKFIVAETARAAGWHASTEEPGSDPDGNPWIADVLCTRDKAKVAFEIQLAEQSLDEYQTRQRRYQRSGIRCLWLTKLRTNGSSIESVPPSKDFPLVLLDVKEPANMTVRIERSEATIPLADFVKGALTGEFFWAEAHSGRVDVELQVASISCWKCHSPIRAIRGYVINNKLVTLVQISDTNAIALFAENLRSQDPRVTPVSKRYSKTSGGRYFAASCPFCQALIGDWFMTADFFTETVDCNYSNCSCPEAGVFGFYLGCHVFEYHPITLSVARRDLAYLPAATWKWRPFTRGATVRMHSKIGQELKSQFDLPNA
ncbi:MAG: hypothetical protein Q7S58_13110 [Candidatus Binatus sp.]|uniref:competence protein CoiA n=1 Tax=Candidatus Binatus sp. TaxID=2811406 RepID=UPI00271B97D8|nr:hypothetical protein [Candidatus Binatus sp.]MDO8433338.1 hypothetical protein [Candidatus Binatus sp.]